MDYLYNLLIPGWTAARAENPLLMSLGRRRRVRERRIEWLLALALVAWTGVCWVLQSLPVRYIAPSMINSWFTAFFFQHPMRLMSGVLDMLGLAVALIVILRQSLDPAQVEEWAVAPIRARDVSHYIWGRSLRLIFCVTLIAIVPLTIYWITIGRGFLGIGDWTWVLYWMVGLPVSLIGKFFRYYFMSLVMTAVFTRRRLATESLWEIIFTTAGLLLIFILFEAMAVGLLWLKWAGTGIPMNVIYVMIAEMTPLLSVAVMLLWGRRMARHNADHFWTWWLDGPRAWRWGWLKDVLFPK